LKKMKSAGRRQSRITIVRGGVVNVRTKGSHHKPTGRRRGEKVTYNWGEPDTKTGRKKPSTRENEAKKPPTQKEGNRESSPR